ncbi:MAG: hypothetical protein ACP5QN_00070 [Minisyncoccia bacterium]
MKFFQEYCFDCGRLKINHLESWLDDFLSLLPPLKLHSKFISFFDGFFEKIFVFLRLLKYEEIKNLENLKIALRSKIFISEILKNKFKVFIGKSIFGYTNNFLVKINNKEIYFQGLPIADHLNYKINLIDNKNYVKKILIENNFPVPQGKVFWFWEKNKALKYGKKLGWPLVVKPKNGTFARHITSNILNDLDLKKGINKALEYAPSFLIEEYIPGFVFRATVIDFEKVFCVKQIPANVCGNGQSTILELVNKKNSNPLRGNPHDKNFILSKILINNTTDELLKQKGYTYNSVPNQGEVVYLQKDPFLRLGGDLEDVTFKIHPDNKKMFQNIAKLFNILVVGIDFVALDIAQSYKNQKCGILELNTLPSIELHTLNNEKESIAKAMFDLFKKYYL